jgi:hypothetical protein
MAYPADTIMVFTKSQLHILTSQKKGELQSLGTASGSSWTWIADA